MQWYVLERQSWRVKFRTVRVDSGRAVLECTVKDRPGVYGTGWAVLDCQGKSGYDTARLGIARQSRIVPASQDSACFAKVRRGRLHAFLSGPNPKGEQHDRQRKA